MKKRKYLGLVHFIGEIFKKQLMTHRVMHACVKKFLAPAAEPPHETDIEALCILLQTTGLQLDTAGARAHMDVYFSLVKDLSRDVRIPVRHRLMLQDLIALRDRNWVALGTRLASGTPGRNASRTPGISQGAFRRDIGPVSPRPPKAGDLSTFGKINGTGKGLPMTFGPSSVFAGKKDKKRGSLPTSSNQNMFSMITQSAADASSESSRGPTVFS
ncbi:armadillo-type protein [Mycena rosella]|uniref:Armadillo-type protein n=1 Tax=Mycena rosella TaxID=1033263 RepID=A0AAD7DMN8_MYCRO|nr:armadillo-type protein [Mycena rosella]